MLTTLKGGSIAMGEVGTQLYLWLTGHGLNPCAFEGPSHPDTGTLVK